MNNVFLFILIKRILKLFNSFRSKLKQYFLPVLALFLFVLFCFFVTNVKAVSEDLPELIVDGYDMSDIYNYFNVDEPFWIVKEGSNYNVLIPDASYRQYRVYNAIVERNNSIAFFDKNWNCLDGNHYALYGFNKTTNKFYYRFGGAYDVYKYNQCPIVYTNKGIYNKDFKTFYMEPTIPFSKPYISNTDDDLINQLTSYLLVFPGSVDNNSGSLELAIYRKFEGVNGSHLEKRFETSLCFGSDFYHSITDNGVLQEFWYEIPYKDMGFDFNKGETYLFSLKYYEKNSSEAKFVNRQVVVSSVVASDKVQDSINIGFENINSNISDSTNKLLQEQQKTQETIKEQTEAIQENTQTNKNIFEKIGDILNILNPFSENFFAYKLIELLLEALKSLFIPSDDFFNNWLADMNDYFSDRFGIIYYPIDLVIDFLTRFVNSCSNISNSALLTIPDLEVMGVVLIHSFTFDFNSLLTNSALQNVYNIYLIVVDVIFSLMLVNYAKKVFVEVFGGHFTDEFIQDITNNSSNEEGKKA